ncbi:pseudouridine synthase [Paenibacillus lentus]|uniref:Pseudouridine synthase n=1 Tax=Paenibacillus lentus TaxID=1338368 RepID=A0A3Q8S649_9BACL|nr:pseudouridine synthase [Paenibacillus lentus]AZK47990.1 rRNA pseudouridine synthase [Paenibacillus lentus]
MSKGKKTQRLDKVLGHLGYGSRSDIKKMVKQGRVILNGLVLKDSGMQCNPYEDDIAVDGERITYREFIYLMLNKPQGVISATEDHRDRTVLDLIPAEFRVFSPFPVGRLDKDTEGLLLLTNDGQLAHELLSPRKRVPKTYEAHVLGEVGEREIALFRQGVTLDDGYVTLPAELEVLEHMNGEAGVQSRIRLTISEGKFHQVKRMFMAVGSRVIYLKRISMGPLVLDDSLALGSFRELECAEVELLKTYKK